MGSRRSEGGRSDSGFIVKLLRNLVLVLLLIVFVSIVYNFRNKKAATETALLSDAISSEKFRGVFIRSETPVTFSGNGVLSYKVADGGKVGSGTVIAEVYPDDEQIMRSREIAQLEHELDILKKIQNPGTLESAQPSSLSASIGESYRTLIYSRDMKDYSALRSEMENLVVGMSTYQIITKEVTGFDQQIIDINSRLAELKGMADAPLETVKANESAYFVSYCDGYESELTPESMDELTVEQLRSIVDAKSSEPGLVGKMIDGYSWYLAGVIDNSRKLYNIGDLVKLKFDSSDEKFDAVITDIRDDSSSSVSIIIIECSRFSKDLVEHRAEACELIKGEYRGLKVPRGAIRFENMEQQTTNADGEPEGTAAVNTKGVYIMKGEQVLFKKIDVVYEGSDYVLSEVHEDDPSYLALYDDILTETEGGELNG
ncbi:MAG: hypothetical protein J6B75_05585 [Ruminococcus sp.]|nr:hypothetical protein [Ruminococcus sp.]